MENVNRLALASLVSLALSSTAMAAQQPVAKLLQVSGKALIETTDGKRQIAQKNMTIAEGSHIIVLEKSKVTVGYLSTDCQAVHQQNTLLTVQESEQCATGQPIAVGAAGAAADSAVPVVKTPPIMKGLGGGSTGVGANNMLPAVALAGGLAVALALSNDDDDGDSSFSGTSLASALFDAQGNEIIINGQGVAVYKRGQNVSGRVAAGTPVFLSTTNNPPAAGDTPGFIIAKADGTTGSAKQGQSQLQGSNGVVIESIPKEEGALPVSVGGQTIGTDGRPISG